MADQPLSTHPPDISLILRAHAEQLWLTAKVMPTLRRLEQPGETRADDEGAALAYLEVLWLDACQRAADTDAALTDLLRHGPSQDRILYEKARRYHAAVRRLRAALACRVTALVVGDRSDAAAHEHAGS